MPQKYQNQAKAKMDGVINPQNYNSLKRYKSTEVNHKPYKKHLSFRTANFSTLS